MEGRSQIPPALRPYADAARTLGARLTTAGLGPGRSAARLDDLARRLQRELDRMMQQAFDALPGEGEIACTAGCDYCCRTLPVAVSPVEVFTIVRRLRDAHRGDAALQGRLAALETPAAAPSTGGPGALPACPLL